MNLKGYIRKILGVQPLLTTLPGLTAGLFLFVMAGCAQDELEQGRGNSNHGLGDNWELIELDGVGAIKVVTESSLATRGNMLGDQDVGSRDGLPSNTRASGDGNPFTDGDGNEFALANGDHHIAILYSVTGNSAPVAVFKLTPYEWKKEEPENITLTFNSVYSNQDSGFSSSVQSSLTTNTGFMNLLQTSECYVILNTNKQVGDFTSVTKDNFLKMTLDGYSIKVTTTGEADETNGSEYFTMSNAVYASGSTVVKGATCATAKIYPTIAEARVNPCYTVYVERLAVKYTVNFAQVLGNEVTGDDGTVSQPVVSGAAGFDPLTGLPYYHVMVDYYSELGFSDQGYTIVSTPKAATVQVLGYGLNCLEQSSYLIKNLKSTYTSGTWNWNDAGNLRSYWSEDPHYEITSANKSDYPVQFRWCLEERTDTVRSLHDAGHVYRDDYYEGFLRNYIDPSVKDSYVLKYVPFESLYGQQPTVMYSHENTVIDNGFGQTENGSASAWNRACYSAATNLVVVAKLNIDGTSGTVFRGQNGIFYGSRDEILEAKRQILNQIILPEGNSGINVLNTDWNNHSDHTFIGSEYMKVLSWNKGSVLWVQGADYFDSSTTIRVVQKEDLWLIPAELKGGDGQRLICPKDPNARYFLAPRATNGDMIADQGVEISYNDVVSLIYKIIGPVERFENGYMYYSMPVTHNVRNFDYEKSWTTFGNVSVVRNNWYNIKITGITGVGTPVDDPKQPIVPVLQALRTYINMTTMVEQWHSIVQQDITPSKKPS